MNRNGPFRPDRNDMTDRTTDNTAAPDPTGTWEEGLPAQSEPTYDVWYGAYDWDDPQGGRQSAANPVASTALASTPAPAAGTEAVGMEPGGDSDDDEAPERIGPSIPQIVGSAAAAVSAALVASQLGVAGTLIGAAVASIVSTIAAAYYTSFATRTHDRVRRLSTVSLGNLPRPVAGASADLVENAAGGPGNDGLGPDAEPSHRRLPRRWWVGAVAAFVLAVAGITAVELGLGHPVSGAEKSGDSGTSVGTVLRAPASQGWPTTPPPTPTSAEPSASTQSPTGSATESASASPSATAPAPTAGTQAPTTAPGPVSSPVPVAPTTAP